ncbi:carboxylate-amine ligase [Algihabitans albus]|uniref:carboxylate-amine ligase n=1 Tax=Algihabitans albus TaxID=2164067 RepID=UPI000E5D10C2|nr:carboxylate-amine ligase [Algihabitans albus]
MTASVEPTFTVGIEEEYLLVDPESRDLVVEPPTGLMSALEDALGERVTPEFLQSQVEIGTSKCDSVREAAAELRELRGKVAEVAEAHDLALLAASTHPKADWDRQKHTDKERYNMLARDIQAPARRLVICGMHVHVGLDDDNLRIDLMGQAAYFTPHLLALSTSSPFWRGRNSGLKSYRMAVFDELPRTGLPAQFDSWGEYQRHLQVLVDAGLIEDGSKLWWDVRPSSRFPTLELRAPDICTRIDDGLAVAAIYLCLLRMLWRLKRTNQRWRRYSNMLIGENRWRAMRYGMDEGLVDFGKGAVVAYPDLLEEILELTREDALALDCLDLCEASRGVIERGTSADRQIQIYDAALEEGLERGPALDRVVDWLMTETVAGLDSEHT